MVVQEFVKSCGEWARRSINRLYRGWRGELIKMDKEHYLFDFRRPETINNFDCLTDSEVGGKSTASITLSKYGRLLFSGEVSMMLEKDIDFTGFCGIRSKPKLGLFNKVELTDIGFYDCVEIKYRGDGRPYFVNVQTGSMMMLNKFDLFQAFLFTKGGPYWEIERIPFSKFYQTYKGFAQDEQMQFNNIRTIGISLTDRKSGPFNLEIEYFKVVKIGHQPQTFKTIRTNRFQRDNSEQ
ncbi:complex I intermediate-associated protein 30, mitochondrial isoform X1 [Hydra vulgaris]|uniref:complex I intermediate-associated protein 30, mitochondrial isoform X1 n=1 Tax=Hydra vulgaris TaxID=6087 RepID=UPI001F5F103F|nr:complex I intermediate-associated protein 30, mitochondrial [Hydra vulgaris]